jgi:predicted nucleic acid-binding protein
VFRVVFRQRGESDALQAIALMHQGQVVDLDSSLAVAAAKIGVEQKLPLADSIVCATARLTGALVWTQDADFDGLPDGQFLPKATAG